MPTYEFVCPSGHQFTRFYRKMSDSVAELPCPECGQVAARKISGGAGLLFKGSGFYITDYGKDGKKNAAPAGTGSSRAGESKTGEAASGTTEGKPSPAPSEKSAGSGSGSANTASAERSSPSPAKKRPTSE